MYQHLLSCFAGFFHLGNRCKAGLTINHRELNSLKQLAQYALILDRNETSFFSASWYAVSYEGLVVQLEELIVNMGPNSNIEPLDICVVGGGIAGILVALKAAKNNPSKNITLFEKKSFLGGRQSPYRESLLTPSSDEVDKPLIETNRQFRGYGLQVIPKDLFELVCKELACGNDAKLSKLQGLARKLSSEIGVIAAGKQSRLVREDLFSGAGFRAIGGAAAQKEWTLFESMTQKNLELDEDKLRERSFAKIWDKGKKSAGSIVLAQYASLLGVADHWTSHLESLRQRIEEFGTEHVVIDSGFFEHVETMLCGSDPVFSNLEVKLNTPILRANFGDQYLSPKQRVEQLYPEGLVAYTEAMASESDPVLTEGSSGDSEESTSKVDPEKMKEKPASERWHLATRKNSFEAKKLVIACSLWNTKSWLPKQYLPQQLIQIAVRSLPVSLVVSHKIATSDLPSEMCDLTIIPAENVQIWKLGKRHVYCQVAVSYEQSIQAKPVVNAIRKIRRSLRKLKDIYPDTEWQDEEHVALVSNGFEVDASAEFFAEVAKVDASVQLPHIGFVGANFGPTYAGYSNLKYSVNAIDAQAQND